MADLLAPVQITPIAAPVKAQMPNAGVVKPAAFSDDTTGIQNLVTAQAAELNVSVDAMKANNQVDQQASTQLHDLNTQNLDIFGRIMKAESLPGGAGGKINKLFSLFNSDYDVTKQKTMLEANQLRATVISNTAASIKENNNALPSVMGKVTQAQKDLLAAQQAQNDLFIKAGTLADKQRATSIAAAHLRLDMNADQRAQTQFAINGLSTAQLQSQLPLAQAGKGPFANKAGLIEERLMHEEAANVSLQSAQIALQKGNREEANASLEDMVSHYPADYSTKLLQQAQQKGVLTVDYPAGPDKDGKPTFIQVPLPTVQAGIVKNAATDKSYNEQLATQITEKSQIIPNVKQIMTAGNSFASLDPKAAGVVQQTASILNALDTKDPNNVNQVALLLKPQIAAMDGIAKRIADQFSTPEAKAAIINYGQGTPFNATGGTAVISDAIGAPAYTTKTHFNNAFTVLGNLVATKIKSADGAGPSALVGADNSGSGSADTMALFAALTQKPAGRLKLSQATAEVLADPSNQKAITKSMTNKIQTDAVNYVIKNYASQKDANPVWGDIMAHPGNYQDKSGNLDVSKIFSTFETLSLQAKVAGGDIDFSKSFLDGLVSFGQNSGVDNDPTYTMVDHALIGAVYNGSPHQNIVGDLHYQLRQVAQKAHAEMMKRVQEDVSGQTQLKAYGGYEQTDVQERSYAAMHNIPLPPFNYEKAFKDTGINYATVPSATGAPVTAEQVKRIFAGGK